MVIHGGVYNQGLGQLRLVEYRIPRRIYPGGDVCGYIHIYIQGRPVTNRKAEHRGRHRKYLGGDVRISFRQDTQRGQGRVAG